MEKLDRQPCPSSFPQLPNLPPISQDLGMCGESPMKPQLLWASVEWRGEESFSVAQRPFQYPLTPNLTTACSRGRCQKFS